MIIDELKQLTKVGRAEHEQYETGALKRNILLWFKCVLFIEVPELSQELGVIFSCSS
jgi:hypothetical protein